MPQNPTPAAAGDTNPKTPMPGEDAIREQVRRLLATADGFSFEGLEPHDYQNHASVVLDMIRPLVFALGQYQALELGTPEGRVSAKCEDSTHPVWLRDLDDMRGCPWCRIAELKAQAADGAGVISALSVIVKHGDMADEVRREIRDLLSSQREAGAL
ncbi:MULTISPECIES: hypothetical protein [Streptomyces]|uniref:hypothetical protein n=1 Tax=Streptomyces TaxID=1883 RepID=UPI00131A5376|nr:MULTISPECIES: hypothetical protein [Streptomyces]MDP9953082.1 hypothetical protein [Streptomyces sp. DSM 41269]